MYNFFPLKGHFSLQTYICLPVSKIPTRGLDRKRIKGGPLPHTLSPCLCLRAGAQASRHLLLRQQRQLPIVFITHLIIFIPCSCCNSLLRDSKNLSQVCPFQSVFTRACSSCHVHSWFHLHFRLCFLSEQQSIMADCSPPRMLLRKR